MAVTRSATKRPAAPARKKPAWVRWTKRVASILFLAGCLAFVVFGGMFYSKLNWAATQVPKLDQELTRLKSMPSVILSADGKELFSSQEEYREPIATIDESVIGPWVKKATLAAEDKRFYDHTGVDWWGVGRALMTNVRERRAAQGASTITMQLAKRLYTSNERSLERKMKDMALAVQIEQKLPKDEILRLYLNQVFYGAGAYGIGAAAKTYFGKEPKKLSLSEAALLARCVRRPSDENPFEDLDQAIANRNIVLRTMLDEAMITKAQYDKARQEVPKLRPKQFASGSRIKASPYFVRYVLDTIKQELPDIDLTEGGYRVETTIDAELDRYSQKVVKQVVDKYRRQRLTTGAFVLMDDEGKILAMTGGVDYDRNEYNVIYQGRRQPGSAFKAIVYATALSTGAIGPYDRISNEQLILEVPGRAPRRWPKNGKARYGGTIAARTAFASSINVPAVRVCEMVGPHVVAQYARDVFGFKSPIDPVLAMALGSSAVSPLEMAQAYSLFMTLGDRVKPFGIKRIIGPDGQVVKEWQPDISRGALDPAVCGTMDEFLRAVVTSGTGGKARSISEARGKTGTTSDNRDAWFCGYSQNLVGIGWVANERKSGNRWVYDEMPSVFGGTVTIEIWTGVMKAALKKHGKERKREPGDTNALAHRYEPPPAEPPVDDVRGNDPNAPDDDEPEIDPRLAPEPGETFPAERVPDPVRPSRPPESEPDRGGLASFEICADTGQLANRYCPETVTRRMPRAEAPRGRCPMHGPN